jgi:hypothetical protein
VAEGRDPLPHDSAGQMVAERVDVWAPVVLAAYAEAEQPVTLVLDSTDFHWTNVRTGTRRREFAILVAYGYTATGRGRVWGVHASPTAQAGDHLDLLDALALPGPARTVVADDDGAIAAAVARAWPAAPSPSLPEPLPFRLRAPPPDAGPGSARGGQRRSWPRPLDAPAGHRVPPPRRLGRVPRRRSRARRRSQVGPRQRRSARPPGRRAPPATSALLDGGCRSHLRETAGLLERRSFALRNADRTNLHLGLARLHLNNQDDVGQYHRILRSAAEHGGGHAISRQRTNRDAKTCQGDPQLSLR